MAVYGVVEAGLTGTAAWSARHRRPACAALAAVGGAVRAFSLTNRELWLATVTATFHGRDIFMPVAAHLAAESNGI